MSMGTMISVIPLLLLVIIYAVITGGKQKGRSSSRGRKTYRMRTSLDADDLKNSIRKASAALTKLGGDRAIPSGGKKKRFSKEESRNALGIRHEKNDPCKLGWEYDVGEKKRKRKNSEDPWDW